MSYKNITVNADSGRSAFGVPGPIAHPVAHIDVFVPHEEGFVPSVKLFKDVTPNEYAEPAKDLCAVRVREEPVPLDVLQSDNSVGDRPDGIPSVLFCRMNQPFKPVHLGREGIIVDETDPGRLTHLGEDVVAARIPQVLAALKTFEGDMPIPGLAVVPPPARIGLEPLQDAGCPVLGVVTCVIEHPELIRDALGRLGEMGQECACDFALVMAEDADVNRGFH